MTTLYNPVLIESAEQAEALPDGTLVRDVRSGFDYRARRALGGYLEYDLRAGVEVIALVPIEAKEERIKDYFFDRPGWMSRLVTPWEAA